MATRGRRSVIDSAIEAEIAQLDAQGLSLDGIVRALAQQGRPVSRRTLGRYFAKHGHGRRQRLATAGAGGSWEPGASAEPALATVAANALESDDLESIARTAAEVRSALTQWAPAIGTDPTAARTFSTLAKLNADLSARLVELRPRADVDEDRLSALGKPARSALLERSRAIAVGDEELRIKNQRLRAVIEKNGWV